MDEFIDFCILCGCDYVPRIGGFGPASAYTAIKEHRTIEKVLEMIEEKNLEFMEKKGKPRFTLPPAGNFKYKEARAQFKKPDIFDTKEHTVKFGAIQKEELIKFLVEEKGFNEDTLKGKIDRLEKAKKTKP